MTRVSMSVTPDAGPSLRTPADVRGAEADSAALPSGGLPTSDPLDPTPWAELYALAARLFARELDAELYRKLTTPEFAALGATLGGAWIDAHVRTLPEDAALECLAVEYCRLFVGPMAVCAPYESLQRDQALLGGRARARVEALLEGYALTLADDARLASPDHAAVELGLLAHLYGYESEAAATASQASLAARRWLRDGLLTWLPDYLDALGRVAVRAPYTLLARFTAALLEADAERHRLPRDARPAAGVR